MPVDSIAVVWLPRRSEDVSRQLLEDERHRREREESGEQGALTPRGVSASVSRGSIFSSLRAASRRPTTAASARSALASAPGPADAPAAPAPTSSNVRIVRNSTPDEDCECRALGQALPPPLPRALRALSDRSDASTCAGHRAATLVQSLYRRSQARTMAWCVRNETRRVTWVKHYVAAGMHDAARALRWDGVDPPPPPPPPGPGPCELVRLALSGSCTSAVEQSRALSKMLLKSLSGPGFSEFHNPSKVHETAHALTESYPEATSAKLGHKMKSTKQFSLKTGSSTKMDKSAKSENPRNTTPRKVVEVITGRAT